VESYGSHQDGAHQAFLAFRRSAAAGFAAVILAIGLGAAGLTTGASPALADSTAGGEITRSEVLARAQNWVDRNVMYNMTRVSSTLITDPEGDHKYGPDCSGYVSMAWHLVPGGGGGLNTSAFAVWNNKTNISLNELKPGDALLREHHIELFARWKNAADHGQGAYVYSLNGTGNPDGNGWEQDWAKGPTPNSHDQLGFNSWSDMGTYQPIRYKNIKDDEVPVTPRSIAVGDLDNDGKKDLVGRKANGDVYFNKNTGVGNGISWGSGFTAIAGSDYTDIAVGDLDNDGKNDLVGRKANGDIYFNKNTGGSNGIGWGAGWTVVAGSDYTDIAVGDLNNDGKNDLVSRKANGDIYFDQNTGGSNGIGWGNGWTVITAATAGY
jgi:hypothetical protein